MYKTKFKIIIIKKAESLYFFSDGHNECLKGDS